MLTGADIASGPVWMEYIAYLKSLPVGHTVGLHSVLIINPFILFPFNCPHKNNETGTNNCRGVAADDYHT